MGRRTASKVELCSACRRLHRVRRMQRCFCLDVFERFQELSVRYLVAGGVALNLHGVPRMTADLGARRRQPGGGAVRDEGVGLPPECTRGRARVVGSGQAAAVGRRSHRPMASSSARSNAPSFAGRGMTFLASRESAPGEGTASRERVQLSAVFPPLRRGSCVSSKVTWPFPPLPGPGSEQQTKGLAFGGRGDVDHWRT